jgi:hypothetical protein
MNFGVKYYGAIGNGQNVILDRNTIEGFITKDVASDGGTNVLGRYMFASMTASGSVDHPTSGSWVAFAPTGVIYDENALYGAGTFTLKCAGMYRIQCNVVFSGNATGYRGLRLKVGGTVIASELRPATNGDSSALSVSVDRILASGALITVEMLQNSGGALTISNTGSFFQVLMTKF